MNTKDTPQQVAVVEAAERGESMVVESRAGSGKTYTAKQVTKALAGKKALYVAFNKSTQTEASQTFPKNVDCRTISSLAWNVGVTYKNRMCKPFGNAPRTKPWDDARKLGVNGMTFGDVELSGWQMLRIAKDAVARFCRSGDDTIQAHHIPRQTGLEEFHTYVVAAILPVANRVWDDIKNGHVLNVDGSHYVKLWCLSKPILDYDVIIFDEAQDANGAFAKVVEDQWTRGAQVIAIGDSAQAINGWNGAVDSLKKFAKLFGHVYPLSKSFRFGDEVAQAGNIALRLLGVPDETLLEGFEQIISKLEVLESPHAVLCRTNAGCVTVAMRYIGEGKKVAIVGGGDAIRKLAEAAVQLKSGRKVTHADLLAFKSWSEVQEYSNEDEGADLLPFVKIIDELGADVVINAMNHLSDARYADVIVSTAHKSKGLEWASVQIHTDFRAPKRNEDGSLGTLSDAALMLLYVAMTRAQLVLDKSALAWLDEYTA
jgi:AAA domain/UvrD-like helicase C-terminal domain